MEKKLNILFLDTRPVRRGAQIFIHELKKQFEQSDIIVSRIFLYREDNYECIPLNNQDLVLDYLDNHWMEKWFFFQPALFKRLKQQIQNLNPDIILCNGSRTLKYAALVKMLSPDVKSKWIYRVIDSASYWNNKVLTALIYRMFIIPAMDAAIGVSNKSLKDMVQHYKFRKPVVAIPRAVDINHFTSFQLQAGSRVTWGIDEQAYVVLFLGNFTHQKRPDRFIQIIAEVMKMNPKVHGLMVGDGPLKKQIEQLCFDLNIGESITFTGYQKDVRAFIAMSDLLMLTSDTEGMPGVVLEAAAMGKFSISGPVGGVAEFIDSNENGIIVSDVNSNLFIRNLNSLIKNNDKNSNMGIKAKKKVIEEYSIDKITLKYLKFFNSCLS
jgi:glycosyltransferase involved in cell wall biosynthesis